MSQHLILMKKLDLCYKIATKFSLAQSEVGEKVIKTAASIWKRLFFWLRG